MSLVVDASVALKWVISEPDSHAADALRVTHDLIAPDLLFLECGSALWRSARRGAVTAEQALSGLTAIQAAPMTIAPSPTLAKRSQTLALELDHPIYVCLYLATALAYGVPLVTADERFL
ncbi:MAG: type II toxin-antitoxin system VapC family toxin [Caulobacterales bacterium]|jgi:predicted nucleic acid-binding protein